MAASSLYSFGLYSHGTLLFLLVTVLTFIFYSYLWGIIILFSALIYQSAIAFLYLNNILVSYNNPVNLNISLSSWILSIVVFTSITLIVSTFEQRLNSQLLKNYRKLRGNQKDLKKINIQLQHEIEYRKNTEELLKEQYAESNKLNNEYKLINSQLVKANAELEQKNQQLFDANEKAKAADKLKSAFLSNMSHEIRTPMNAIIGFSTLLINSDLSKDDSMRYINIIQSSSNSLLSLISDIVTMSKIESGQYTIYPESINLNSFIDEISEKYTAETFIQKENNVKFTVNYDIPDICIIDTDKESIWQITSKLIDNAIKFTNDGVIDVNFSINKQNILLINVADTGNGISSDGLNHIFDTFTQIDGSDTRKYGGVGLGLSITNGLVNLLNGTINITSQPGLGTNVKVMIPVAGGYNNNNIDSLNLKGKTILVVGKIVWDNSIFNHVLLESGATIIFTENGYKAINVFNDNVDINLVIIDNNIDNNSTIKITEKIKQLNNNTKIILFNNSPDKQLDNNNLFSAIINEPLDKQLLINAIKKIIPKLSGLS